MVPSSEKIKPQPPASDQEEAVGVISASPSSSSDDRSEKYAQHRPRKDTASTIGTASLAHCPSFVSSSSPAARVDNHNMDADKQQPSSSDNDDKGEPKNGACYTCCSTIQSRWSTLMDWTRAWITLGVVRLAKVSARNPYRCISFIVVLSIFLLIVGALTNLNMNVNSREQMTPNNSVQRLQRAWIDNEAGFPPQPQSMHVMVHADGRNVLSQQGIWHAFQVLDTVTGIPGYEEYCQQAEALAEQNKAGYTSYCIIQGVTLLWNNSRAIAYQEIHSDTDVILAVNAKKYPNGGDVDVREIMGKTTVHYNTVIEAHSFMIEVMIPDTQEGGKELATQALRAVRDLRLQWEQTETEVTVQHNDTTGLNTFTPFFRVEVMLTDHSIEEEMLVAAFKDIPLVPAVFVIMTIFTCIVFSATRRRDQEGDHHPCEQRILLGIGAVLTVVLSLASGYGLLWIIGVPFTSITQIIPFVMFGIGLDAAYVIFGEFVRTDASKDPVERVGATFEEVGLSIVLTTLTTAVAFGMSCFGGIPNLQWMSLYAFPVVLIDFIFQITLFVALIVLDERRLKRNRQRKEEKQLQQQSLAIARGEHLSTIAEEQQQREEDVMEERAVPHVDNRRSEGVNNGNVGLRSSITNTINVEFLEDHSRVEVSSHDSACEMPEQAPERQQESQMQDHSAREELLHIHNHHHKPGPPASLMDQYMGWYAERLLRPWVKGFVIVAFTVLTAGLAYSTAKFTQGFDILQLMPKGSYLVDFFNAAEEYANPGWLIPLAYFRYVDQSDPAIQVQMDNYINDLVTLDTISSQPPYFWLRHFKLFLTYDDRLPPLDFNLQMDIFLSIDQFRMLYGDHIIRDADSGNITASRCVMYMDQVDVSSVRRQIKNYLDIRNVTLSQPINGGVVFTQLAEPIRGGVKYADGFTDEEVQDLERNLSFFLYEGTMFYAWEFYNMFVGQLMSTSIWGLVSVALVGFLFLPHWTATLFLFPIISALCIDLIGFLQLCGVHLNAFSYFCLNMSIGLQVDFNMHILLRYYESPLQTRNGKVKDALQSMGSSVVLGGISTILGVLPLVFSASDLMKILFYGFTGMVLLGCSHGVILLPVLLSFVGPINKLPPPESASASVATGSVVLSSYAGNSQENFDGSSPNQNQEQPSVAQPTEFLKSPTSPSIETDESHTSDEVMSEKVDEEV